MPILKIECGQLIDTGGQDIDTGSSGTNRRFEKPPPEEYVIYPTCPVIAEGAVDPVPELEGFITLTVPPNCNITDMLDLEAAREKLLSGGTEVYRCSRANSPRCPLLQT